MVDLPLGQGCTGAFQSFVLPGQQECLNYQREFLLVHAALPLGSGHGNHHDEDQRERASESDQEACGT